MFLAELVQKPLLRLVCLESNSVPDHVIGDFYFCFGVQAPLAGRADVIKIESLRFEVDTLPGFRNFFFARQKKCLKKWGKIKNFPFKKKHVVDLKGEHMIFFFLKLGRPE
jgi:hypothetical protein